MKKLIRILAAALCLALAAVPALANEVMDLSMDGYDCFDYAGSLPDGRLVFTGSNGKPGNYMDQKARILCLNPDRTVSWEYIHPAEGCWGFHGITPMEDGTLCVRLCNSPYQRTAEDKLVFFTPDGQLTGREIPLEVHEEDDPIINQGILSSSCRFTSCFADEEEKCYTEYTDWDGNLLFRINGRGPIREESIIPEADGLVMMGCEQGRDAAAKILKMDWQGNILWETVVPFISEVNRGAMMQYGMKTGDGGYLAVVAERPVNISTGGERWKTYLVKFSASGRILWKNEAAFDALPSSMVLCVEEYNGKYVVEVEDKDRFASPDMPFRYLWFDTEGKELGMTELYVRKEDVPRLAKGKKMDVYGGGLVIMADGLWGDFSCDNGSNDHEKNMASLDEVLIKIPEL